MRKIENILVVQTAFIGDVILTLPLVQVLKEYFAFSNIDVVVVPRAAELLANHPAIGETIVYDKRGADAGWKGFKRLLQVIRSKKYDLALLPHRSLRSGLLAFLAGIPLRIGFSKSVARPFYSKSVKLEKGLHEIERNLSLLGGIGIEHHQKVLPDLYPSEQAKKKVDRLLADFGLSDAHNLIGIAPGTVWNTKRWLEEGFAVLIKQLSENGWKSVLLGGKGDEALCSEILALSGDTHAHSLAGKLSLLESAELLRRCRSLVSNDSAPMHLAVAMRTPVVAIFGATVPAFGFAPYGEHDVVVETRGLSCRPCSNHGGEKCPIKTFECMKQITPEKVFMRLTYVLEKTAASPQRA